MAMTVEVLAGLAFMFSSSILLQILLLCFAAAREMTTEGNFVQPAIPRFDGHYDHWSMLMENFLRSKEYWSLVETGYVVSEGDATLTEAQQKKLDEMKLKDLKACAIYSNWWPLLSAVMYVLVPMPCLFFGGGSTQFLISRDGGGWMDAAKFLTGASAVGSMAIPIILRHAGLIGTGAMIIEFTSFFIFVCTVLFFHRSSLDDEW